MTAAERYDDAMAQRADQVELFAALAAAYPIQRVLYPGSYLDISPSFVFPSVTYVDTDRRAKRFFADVAGVRDLVRSRQRYDGDAEIVFHHADYTGDLDAPAASFDLLVSLYAGFVSSPCTRYLRRGGWLLANNSHGDASMARLDPGYQFVAAMQHRPGRYRLATEQLDAYFVPKRAVAVTPELLRATNRGVGYTKSAAAYVFQRR
jgi:hypothetical protein